MKKKIIPLILLLVVCHVSHAVSVDNTVPAVVDKEEVQSDTYVPPVQNYGNFILECISMDYLYNRDANVVVPFHNIKKFDLHSLFRASPSFLYAIRINQSRFALCVGLGVSMLYYTFASIENEDNTYGKAYSILKRESKNRTECKPLQSKQGKALLRSAIKIPFIDCLFRLRFNTVLDSPNAGFHTWLGFKVGFRQRASMMIKYNAYDDSGASSDYGGYFNLKLLTYGVQAGVGYSRFGLRGGFNLTSLFKKNEGPSNSDLLRPFSFGIYMALY